MPSLQTIPLFKSVSAQIRAGGFLGTFQLLREMPEYERYKAAVLYANKRMSQFSSIVSNSIDSAVDGEYGNGHQTERTSGSDLWINLLMGTYWVFRLPTVIQHLHYIDHIKATNTFSELKQVLADFRERKRLPI